MEKKPIRFYAVFVHFSRTYEIVNVSRCKRHHTGEKHTKYANCDLPVNFSIFFFFMMKKDYFKQKCSFGLRYSLAGIKSLFLVITKHLRKIHG